MNPPIIIMGMHRSGTSLVARLLESLGLFIGAFKDSNHESYFFQTINDWLLRIAGGSWDNPCAFDRLLQNNEAHNIVLNHTGKVLNSFHNIRYAGLKHFRRHGKCDGYDLMWGWKDPRNSITLPIWLKLFPEARVIHVCRHGIDVAHSLHTRQKTWFRRAERPNTFRRIRYLLRPFGGIYLRSVGFQTYEEGIDLWAIYMQRAYDNMALLRNSALDIRYEDLLLEPEKTIRQMAEYCGLKLDAEKFPAMLNSIHPDRAYAYRKECDLTKLAALHSQTLNRFGY